MADGEDAGPVDAHATGPCASATDYVPLDDSNTSTNAQNTPICGQDDDDSASDVSMAQETDDESDVEPPTILPASDPRHDQSNAAVLATASPSQNNPEVGELTSRKRKSLADVPDEESLLGNQEVKKVKIQQHGHDPLSNGSPVRDRSTLPAEIWHHIFTFCPPRTLGKLFRVNRLFNSYLDPASPIRDDKTSPLPTGALALAKPNSIWQASRRRFWPTMPTPLQDRTELYMWQLSCSTSCQSCGKPEAAQQQDSADPWQLGPGKEGVSIIWTFAARACGACLLSKSIKVCLSSVYFSNYGLLTRYQEIDILLSSSIPSALTAALPFVFVTQELHVISLSTVEKCQTPPNVSLTKLYWGAHVEELKQEFFTVKSMGTATAEEWLKGLDCRGKERRSDASRWENWAILSGGLKQMRALLYPGYKPPPAPIVDRTATSEATKGLASISQIPGLGLPYESSRAATPSAASSQQNGTTPNPFRRSSTGTASLPPNRTERTKEQVAGLKATRKAEIERRALELDPPLPASILAQIPSFQAALQMITPMDDQAWETLKPRLLAQRGEAEQREREISSHIKREMEDKKSLSAPTKEAREAEDADWDEVQAPVRARIAGYADEIIRDGWEDGDKVVRENCSKFAVEVLIYIRKRFYAEVAKDAVAARAAGKPPAEDPPQGPFTQKLTLENMKWIFDVKVKPHTERHRKEIFLCNGCDVTVRYYGFEGVIQHYAAKHTNALSIGNVVVHWRAAEWPEHPPFTWEPKPAKNGPYQSQPPGTSYNTHSQTSQQSYRPPPGGPTPTPSYGPPSWNEQYGQTPQPPFPVTTTGYAPPQAYGASPYPADPYASVPPAQGQHGAYPGAVPPSSVGQYNYNYGAYQSNSQVGYQAMQPAPFSAQYRSQLEEMARMARELWNATTNMKDTLSIVRVQVVVFHLAKRFHANFGIPLPLATFIDGLSNHKDMRPVRNVNGLICRVCHQGVGGYVASDEERKSYSLPQLTAHFQTKHVDPFAQMGQYGQPPEWTVDMVLLPEPSAVPNLRAAVSMDGQKYHLINEAVPHLLGASGTSGTSQAATNTAPAWQDHGAYYQGYQGAAVDSQQPYYGQSPPNVPQPDITAGQHQNTAVPPAHPPTQPPHSYNYSGPDPAAAMPMPPATVYTPSEPGSTVQNVATTGRGSDQEGRPSHSYRQRQSKKNKKKGGNVRDNDDAEAKKREEEEAKMAEEEAEREGDVIRAMWAADRAKAARKSALPESDVPDTRSIGKTDSSSTNNMSGKSSRPSSKPGTPQPRQQRFQSRPPRDSPRRSLDTLDTRLPLAAPAAQKDAGYRGHQLSNVTYMDGGRDSPFQRDGPGTPGRYEQYDRSASQRPADRRRSRSPVYIDLNRLPTASQYRQRTPPRQQPPVGDAGYPHPSSGGSTRPPAIPLDDVRYERPPLPPPPHRDGYVPRDYAGPALIEYEIIEYRNPDGTTWIEERPLRRIPNAESERYYRDVAHTHPPPPPVTYDRGEPYPYRREHLVPSHHPSSPGPGPGARPREAYPPHHTRGPPYDVAPSSYSSRAPPSLPPQHQASPVSLGGVSAAHMYEYDPRRPSEAALPAPSSSRMPLPPPSRTAGYYGGGGGGQQHQVEGNGEDDYDPRFPAAPPGPTHGTGPAPRTARYYG